MRRLGCATAVVVLAPSVLAIVRADVAAADVLTVPTITAPAAGAVAGDVPLTATSTAARVQFFVDTVALGTPVDVVSGTATTSWPTWGLANASNHDITAADCDVSVCSVTVAAAVTVSINNDLPSVPTPGADASVGESTLFQAASTGGGLQFLIDGLTVGFDGTAPYAFTYATGTLTEGSHQVAVKQCSTDGVTCDGPTSPSMPFTVVKLHPVFVSLAPSPFSPNHDGYKDALTTTFTLPATMAATYTIVNATSHATVRGPLSLGTIAGGTIHTAIWTGVNQSGAVVPDGTYSYVLSVTRTVAGITYGGAISHNVVVDNHGPGFCCVTGSGAKIYPYPDGYYDTFAPRVGVGEGAVLYLVIYNRAKVPVYSRNTTHSGPGTYSLAWNGIYPNGAKVPAGNYYFRFAAHDLAGNKTYTGYYPISVSWRRLLTLTKTIVENGDQASSFGSTDWNCADYSYNLSVYLHGVWLDNFCADQQLIHATYTFKLPIASTYKSVRIESIGSTVSSPEYVGASIWNYAQSKWDVVGVSSLPTTIDDYISTYGTPSASGHVSGTTALIGIDELEGYDYDIAAVRITVTYGILQ